MKSLAQSILVVVMLPLVVSAGGGNDVGNASVATKVDVCSIAKYECVETRPAHVVGFDSGIACSYAVIKNGIFVSAPYDKKIEAIQAAQIPGCIYRGPSVQDVLDSRQGVTLSLPISQD